MSSKSQKDTPPLPLGDLLRDLALLRAADIDFNAITAAAPATVPATPENPAKNTILSESLIRSQEFVKDARSALKILNREEVEKEGVRIDAVRAQLEEVLHGLEGASLE